MTPRSAGSASDGSATDDPATGGPTSGEGKVVGSALLPSQPLDYVRDPAEIYRRSFETIRREADLSAFSGAEVDIVVRVIHACGMPEVAQDMRFHGDVGGATATALAAGAPVLVDTRMVQHGLIASGLAKGNDIHCLIGDHDVATAARAAGTTRAAMAVSHWGALLRGAIVVIGNAPTALFALLERIDQGGPRPAGIFAFPVGFIGAAESKAELNANPRGLDCVTLLGRRGGSAMAGAAFNAVTMGTVDR